MRLSAHRALASMPVAMMAVMESESEYIVTFNLRDFARAEQFGVAVVEPRRFLDDIGRLP